MKWFIVEYLKNGSREQQAFKAESLKSARQRGEQIARDRGGHEPSVRAW